MRKHYVGMDVHQASTSIAVMNGQGRVISESLIETKAQTIVDFLKGLSGAADREVALLSSARLVCINVVCAAADGKRWAA